MYGAHSMGPIPREVHPDVRKLVALTHTSWDSPHVPTSCLLSPTGLMCSSRTLPSHKASLLPFSPLACQREREKVGGTDRERASTSQPQLQGGTGFLRMDTSQERLEVALGERSARHVAPSIQITWSWPGAGPGQRQGMAEGFRLLMDGCGWTLEAAGPVPRLPCSVPTEPQVQCSVLRLTRSHTRSAAAPLQPFAQTSVYPIKLRMNPHYHQSSALW